MEWRRSSRACLAAFASVLAAAVATSSLAPAEKPVEVTAGTQEVIFNSDFSPKKLSKKRSEPTPIAFSFSFFRKVVDEQPPPSLKEFHLEGDKHLSVDVKGIPTCKLGGYGIRRDLEEIRRLCRPALIGSGHMEVVVKFPDQPPLTVESQVLAVNGGVKDGVKRAYLYTYFSAPVTSLIVTTVEIRKIRKGRYGTEVVGFVPKIAGGAGAVTRFHLTLKKGIVSAACADGRLNARGTAAYADGTSSYGTVIRTCTARPAAVG